MFPELEAVANEDPPAPLVPPAPPLMPPLSPLVAPLAAATIQQIAPAATNSQIRPNIRMQLPGSNDIITQNLGANYNPQTNVDQIGQTIPTPQHTTASNNTPEWNQQMDAANGYNGNTSTYSATQQNVNPSGNGQINGGIARQ